MEVIVRKVLKIDTEKCEVDFKILDNIPWELLLKPCSMETTTY
jgi:hypothetical protein